MKEGIRLPTIVVVGDQSFGKSSVLESLAGISLPRSQGICTRVPLIMRLKNNPTPTPELHLEYNGKTVPVEEAHIATAITVVTDEIAGHGKGISNTPLTLVVKKEGVPDLTMIDLPGIVRVSVHDGGQERGENSCRGTKANRAPEELLEKVTADDVNIGLGYVCVRNRVGDESFEEARMEAAALFETHPQLSRIDKSIVGIPVLAQKLVQIQANIIVRCLPLIVKNISEKLNANVAELENLPKALVSAADVMTAFMRIIGAGKESLRKLLLRGEFDEFPEDTTKHGSARLVEMLNQFSNDLHNKRLFIGGDKGLGRSQGNWTTKFPSSQRVPSYPAEKSRQDFWNAN
ncbi:hypothetical protein CCACVL1_06725 [Corchorus capsularis]|uniref:Dynamin-type G domain-containing protein n=1 Tax=Corchorus capsularis TaxID=210143 RepID=A0A1R3JDJ9_COCAP|nr:hypothetical protein CCACVL1_06725 [Corchorus capsularis]